MLRIDSKIPIDVNMYEKEIGMTGFDMFIDGIKYQRTMDYAKACFDTAVDILNEEITAISAGRQRWFSKREFCELLIRLGIPENYLKGRGASGGYSLDANKVCRPIIDFCKRNMDRNPTFYATVKELMTAYIDYAQAKHLIETMAKKIDIIHETDKVDNNDLPLYAISSMYEKKRTGRYYTNSDNLQGWNLKAVESFSSPKDYFIVWADFDQIDLRVASNLILFKDNPELVEDFERTEDKYEAMSRIIASKLNRPFNIQKFQANRKAFKVSILARLYGAGLPTIQNNGFKDRDEAEALDTYFREHEFYQEYAKSFDDAINFGTEVTVYDYFGTSRRIDVPTDKFRKAKIKEECLNTPVQSTSNGIVMSWVNALTKFFRDKDFGPDLFRPYLIRHDEGLFLVHKSMMDYMWVFEDYGSVGLDDWTELTVKAKLGYTYKAVDEELTSEFEKVCKENRSNMTKFTKGAPKEVSYVATGKVAEIYMYAPVSKGVFVYNMLMDTRDWQEEALEIREKIVNNALDLNQFAVDLAHAYRDSIEDADTKIYITSKLEKYNKYLTVSSVKHEDGTVVKVPKKDLYKYLRSKGYTYGNIHNCVVTDYAVDEDMQFKYIKHDTIRDVEQYLEDVECNG